MLPIFTKRSIILFTPLLIAVGFITVMIFKYGVNVPYLDEWEMVPLFQQADTGKLPIAGLWAQHNEHRILFPNLIIYSSAYLSNWNIAAESLMSIIISIISILMIYLFILKKFTKKYIAMIAVVAVSALFYSPVQWENWLWGWQIEWFLCVAAVITSIYLLDYLAHAKKHATSIFIGAIASAVVATFSLGSGILIWVVGFGMLKMYRSDRMRVITWITAAITSTFVYYFNYTKPIGHPPISTFLHQPARFVGYLLAFYGRPISEVPNAAITFGAVLLSLLVPVLYLLWMKRIQLDRIIFWLALIAFSLAAGLVTAISRVGFGVQQGMASRYTSISLIYLIGLVGLIFTLIDTARLKKAEVGAVIMLICSVLGPLIISSYANGIVGFKNQSAHLKLIQQCTHEYEPSKECLLTTYPSATVAKERLDYLKQKHWASY